MQENDNKKEDVSWKTVEECLASEIIGGTKRETKALYIGMICLSVVSLLFIGGLLATNHLNTQSFLNYLSEYDFVSQDGEGYNYYNSDIGGNVSNGSENQKTEEPEQSERDGN